MKHYKYFSLSLFMHMFMLIAFSFYFNDFTTSKKFGNVQAKAMSAFIYQGDFSQPTAVQEKVKSNHIKKSLSVDMRSLNALKIKQAETRHEKNVKQLASTQESQNQGEFAATLIALLHDAIQRKQHYPASAWEMQREGKVTVAFYLYVDGSISSVRILASSGTASLDQAALQAVRDAAPFRELLAYIKHTQEYQIDIVFELA